MKMIPEHSNNSSRTRTIPGPCSTDFVSPVDVMDQVALNGRRQLDHWKEGLPFAPDIEDDDDATTESDMRDSVSTFNPLFNRFVSFEEPLTHEVGSDVTLTEEEHQSIWWTKSEIQALCLEARKEGREQNTYSQLDESLAELYQQAKLSDDLSTLLHGPVARRLLKQTMDVRGLEPFSLPVKQARTSHIKGVLKIQRALKKNHLDMETCWEVLRTRSVQTSRASKAVARLMAHGDYMQVVDMVHQELSS